MDVDTPPSPSRGPHQRTWTSGRQHWPCHSPLEYYCRHPERFPAETFYCDDTLMVIADKYPKARYHFLILPRIPIHNIYDLESTDAPLIAAMAQRAEWLIETIRTNQLRSPTRPKTVSTASGNNKNPHPHALPAIIQALPNHVFQFLVGFHTVPSLPQLHLHVISDDLLGPVMKSAGKWNTFTTPFLRPPAMVYEQLVQSLPPSASAGLPSSLLSGLSSLSMDRSNRHGGGPHETEPPHYHHPSGTGATNLTNNGQFGTSSPHKPIPYEQNYEMKLLQLPLRCIHCNRTFVKFPELRSHRMMCYIQAKQHLLTNGDNIALDAMSS
ncbi:aprataxin-like protein [Dimargaris cristalligena]|nr:aprataxin-like protein [Dimargaris cristalligena]